MKRLWILLLLLAVFAIPARAEMDGDGVYTLYDDQGNELQLTRGKTFIAHFPPESLLTFQGVQ